MARRWAAGCLLLTLWITAAPGEELARGREYAGGAVLYSPAYGLTFQVPSGWRALYPASGQMILLTSARGGRGLLEYALGLGAERLREELNSERWVADGLTLKPSGAVHGEGSKLRLGYGGPEGVVGRGLGLLDTGGLSVIAVVAGPADQTAALEASLDEMASSFRWEKSALASELNGLEARLNNTRVHSVRVRTVDDYTETRHLLYDLCAGKTFSFQGTFEASAPGKDGFPAVKRGPRTTDRMKGQWRLIQRLDHRPTLMFTSPSGEIAYQPLEVQGEEILLDGRPTTISPSDACRN